MTGRWRRAATDIRRRREVDAYVVSALALVLAVLTVLPIPGDDAPWQEQARWAVALAALCALVFRSVTPSEPDNAFETVADDRSAFDRKPLATRWEAARDVCIFAPSAVNILSAQNVEVLRRGVLSNPSGRVRVVVIDREAAAIAARQMEALELRQPSLISGLDATLAQLRAVATWQVHGQFEYRLLDYNPGFSIVGTNPKDRDGSMIVEFHGFANQTTGSRMHLELTRAVDERWYIYWWNQFERIWDAAKIVPLEADPSEPSP